MQSMNDSIVFRPVANHLFHYLEGGVAAGLDETDPGKHCYKERKRWIENFKKSLVHKPTSHKKYFQTPIRDGIYYDDDSMNVNSKKRVKLTMIK